MSRLVPKKVLAPLERHRGRYNTQQRVLESSQFPGRKQKGAPELISCMKRGQNKNSAVSRASHTSSPPAQRQNRRRNYAGGATTPSRLPADTQGLAVFNHSRHKPSCYSNPSWCQLIPSRPAACYPARPPSQGGCRGPHGAVCDYPTEKKKGFGGFVPLPLCIWGSPHR